MKLNQSFAYLLVILLSSFISVLTDAVSATENENVHVAATAKRDVANIANDFFRIQQTKSVKISPNGAFVTYRQRTGTHEQFIVTNTRTGLSKALIVDKFNDALQLDDYYWIDNESIIIQAFISGKGSAVIHSQLVFSDNELSSVNTKMFVEGVTILDPLRDQENIFLAKKWINERAYLFKLDVSSKSTAAEFKRNKRLNLRAPKNPHWLTDADGNIVIGYGHDDEDRVNRAYLKPLKKRKWEVFWEGDLDTVFKPVVVSRDRKTVYVLSNENSDLICLYTYNVDSKTYMDEVFCHDSYDINSVITSSDKSEVLGISILEDGFLQTLYFNSLDQGLDLALKQEFETSIPYIVDYNADKSVLIVETTANSNPGDYFIFDVGNMLLTKFASKAPWLEKYNHSESRVVRAISSDGQEIESYLTLPVITDDSAHKPPLIVMPHGGPISVRDTRHFDRHVQFLTALGYAVLQTNYRGSSGYGKNFLNMGMGQWGRLIEDDIEASIQEVIELGSVDKDKVCIYGISYGGYSALISSIHRPSLFKCAASYAGVSDLPLLFTEIELLRSRAKNSMMKKIVGDPETDLEELMYFSPVYQAEKLQIPIFISHGKKDNVVDIEHFNRLKMVLDAYQKPYTEMTFDNETHGFRYLDNVTEFYIELDKFFQRSFALDDPTPDA
ncbi:alpha/beta hydrolase family protein [Glaciecola siphonariae]|uniref:Alpha/beta hydrolase family protein n=1 Tax=Glaciecola siphonariae TaxID=521012 RepID=A0ABV9LZS9_9ALTE